VGGEVNRFLGMLLYLLIAAIVDSLSIITSVNTKPIKISSDKVENNIPIIMFVALVADTAGEVGLSDVSQGSYMRRPRLGARLVPMPG
jgi:hypothetical protein